jgi:hypothetical protein
MYSRLTKSSIQFSNYSNKVSFHANRNQCILLCLLLVISITLLSFLYLASQESQWNKLSVTNNSPNVIVKPIQRRPLLAQNQSVLHLPQHPISGAESCENTIQGRYLLCDSTGAVCNHNQLTSNNCCNRELISSNNILSCSSCNSEYECCSSYEYCVSCCMKAAGMDKFQLCLATCRTHSGSISHGNEYKNSKYKYCYSNGGKEKEIDMDYKKNTLIVRSDRGASCSLACAKISKHSLTLFNASIPTETQAELVSEVERLQLFSGSLLHDHDSSGAFQCWESYLPKINHCNDLNRHFACKSCSSSTGADQPAYLVEDGQCLYNTDTKLFDCDGQHENTQRLCPCLLLNNP